MSNPFELRAAHFNQLTPAQAECLALIAEEAAEVIQVVGKALRHGLGSRHPNDLDGPNNSELLEKELGDLRAAVNIAIHNRVLRYTPIDAHADAKLERIAQYLHHARLP